MLEIYFEIIFYLLGGNFGLFTGMSFRSLLELLYWISKVICRIPFKLNPNQRLNNREASRPKKKITWNNLTRRRMTERKNNQKYERTDTPSTPSK